MWIHYLLIIQRQTGGLYRGAPVFCAERCRILMEAGGGSSAGNKALLHLERENAALLFESTSHSIPLIQDNPAKTHTLHLKF